MKITIEQNANETFSYFIFDGDDLLLVESIEYLSLGACFADGQAAYSEACKQG